ncbi:hypothetical protein SMICM17S_00230 [Streptomyces microflavus]
MRAIRLHAFGPAESLTYERTEDPVPGPGQVQIAVEAAGVHLLDTALREGESGPYPAPVALPTVPGREVAGTVESLGEGTDSGWLGKRVRLAHIGTAPGALLPNSRPPSRRSPHSSGNRPARPGSAVTKARPAAPLYAY